MSEFKPRYLAFGGRGQRDEITPRGRVYWGGEWSEAEREEARRVDAEMSEQTVEEARRQGLLHMRRLEVWRQFARYSVRGDEVRDEVDAALDAFAGEALREREVALRVSDDLFVYGSAEATAVLQDLLREREAEVERLRDWLSQIRDLAVMAGAREQDGSPLWAIYVRATDALGEGEQP